MEKSTNTPSQTDAKTETFTPADTTVKESTLFAVLAYVPILFIVTLLQKGEDEFHMWHAKMGALSTLTFLTLSLLWQIFYMGIIGTILYFAWLTFAIAGGFMAWQNKKLAIPGLSQIANMIPLEKFTKKTTTNKASATEPTKEEKEIAPATSAQAIPDPEPIAKSEATPTPAVETPEVETTEPVAETPIPEPAIEAVTEPITETPAPEPSVETVAEPIIEPTTEVPTETAPETTNTPEPVTAPDPVNTSKKEMPTPEPTVEPLVETPAVETTPAPASAQEMPDPTPETPAETPANTSGGIEIKPAEPTEPVKTENGPSMPNPTT